PRPEPREPEPSLEEEEFDFAPDHAPAMEASSEPASTESASDDETAALEDLEALESLEGMEAMDDAPGVESEPGELEELAALSTSDAPLIEDPTAEAGAEGNVPVI